MLLSNLDVENCRLCWLAKGACSVNSQAFHSSADTSLMFIKSSFKWYKVVNLKKETIVSCTLFVASSASCFDGEFAKRRELGWGHQRGWMFNPARWPKHSLREHVQSLAQNTLALHATMFWNSLSIMRRWSIIKSPCSLSCQETCLGLSFCEFKFRRVHFPKQFSLVIWSRWTSLEIGCINRNFLIETVLVPKQCCLEQIFELNFYV